MSANHSARVLVSALALVAGAAQAQVSFVTQAGVVAMGPCPSFCRGDRFAFDGDGGAGQASSYASVANNDGHGQAQAVLTGPTNLPILRADAYANPLVSSMVTADATAMQGFYLGANALGSYTLNITLTGQATGLVSADILLFQDSDPSTEPGFSSGVSTMAFEVIPFSGDLTLLDRASLQLGGSGLPESDSATVGFSGLPTGSLVYVWAQVSARGINGTYADGYHTLNMQFTDDTGLSQTAPVPEPGTAATLLGGLALLAAYGRSATRRAASSAAARSITAKA